MTTATSEDRVERVEQILCVLLERSQCAPTRWFSLKLAAEYTSLSEKSLRQLVNSGKLTARRPVRGKILIDRVELDSLIASATATPRTGRGLSPGTRAANAGRARPNGGSRR